MFLYYQDTETKFSDMYKLQFANGTCFQNSVTFEPKTVPKMIPYFNHKDLIYSIKALKEGTHDFDRNLKYFQSPKNFSQNLN